MAEGTNKNVPGNWFKYEWPVPVAGTTRADYSPKKVAPLIEGIASIFGLSRTEVQFRYAVKDQKDQNAQITVSHPNDKSYQKASKEKSPELLRYEASAKSSVRLALFEKYSPAKITYFK